MATHSLVRCLLAAALGAVALTGAVKAQDPGTFERVLVPVAVSGVAGAFDTVWSTELWYRNNSDRPVAMFPVSVGDFVPTVGRTAFLPIGSAPASAPGKILYVSRDGVDRVQFDLRLFNRRSPDAAWGTQLPVVREGEYAEFVDLLNVPTGPEFRSTLRIYGLMESPAHGEAISVQIYSYREELLGSTDVFLDGWPPYASISSLTELFPQIGAESRVRVRIAPRGGDPRIWAFVSVVSNATQHVALVTPR